MRDSDSVFTPASIQAMAQIACINRLSDEAAKALAPDLDYRLREIIQEAQKFARHAKRTKLTTEDINNALRIRNFEPMFGYVGGSSGAKGKEFHRLSEYPEVSVVKELELTFDQVQCAGGAFPHSTLNQADPCKYSSAHATMQPCE